VISWSDRWAALRRLWPALLLIVAVLGSIYTGVTTPTESAAIGVLGAFLVAALHYRVLNAATLWRVLQASTRTTASILIILAAAFIFSQFLLYSRVPEAVSTFMLGLGLSPLTLMVLLMVLFVFLGMLIDAASLVLVTTPIFLPTIVALGYDPLWFGIILTINMEMAVITPPVGLNLYTLKSVAPDLSLEDIIGGTLPYVLIDFAVLFVFVLFPDWVLWLPRLAH
ncbi:MAG TPA: TRAP transporter large permease subunit, partial [Bacillota bacterium]